ncbi:MAG TPA: hypothetical protein VK831_01315 [Candidatus Deferrimicrobiaceae bacterium]|nr:hypothetical protein [Candidatus Deferrimicrobiaceae bacterium]
MAGRVAQGAAGSRPSELVVAWLERLPAAAIGAALVGLALAAFWLPGHDRIYNHFVWQAQAFLHGTAVIDWPVDMGGFPRGNDWMQDVYPLRELTGDPEAAGALLPFPPLPAVALLPFVALWGLATDIRAVSVLGGTLGLGLAWWAFGGLPVSRPIRLATTVFFGFGTVFWYAAQLGTTWFFAHVVAVDLTLLAVGIALRADPSADDPVDQAPEPARLAGDLATALRRPLELVDRRQLLAGLLFGLACTARLTVAFAAPFFMLVGGGGSWTRRSFSAGLGAVIPVGLLLAYNVATTGHLFHPGYEYQYQREAQGYAALGYHPDWGIEDPRYLPQNVGIMLLSAPAILPEQRPGPFGDTDDPACAEPGDSRSLFDRTCPIAIPRAIGMSVLLTSPAYLLALPALLRRRSRLVAGAWLAVLAVALVNLMHFSQGWVQFGYRFSNDFAVLAALLVGLGMARRGGVGLAGLWLIGASVAVNLWGVIWGNILGW